MKNIAIIFSIAFFCFGFTSWQHEGKNFRPPGTVEIVEGFFFDDIERTNLDWREYLTWIVEKGDGKDSETYKNALPDTTVWMSEFNDGEPFKQTYFRHSSYNDYPVVGISYEQAVAYCNWRTDRVKEMCQANGIDFPNFKYRLPTNLEWELIATTGRNNHEKKVKKVVKKYGYDYLIHNLVYNPSETAVKMTAPARSYLPNGYEIYNIIGNVSEMVAEKGVAKGGSFLDPFEEGIVSKKYKYDAPKKWLGFRCVAEVVE
jgi:formylglycine-generating enzyme required for sulfatase activity